MSSPSARGWAKKAGAALAGKIAEQVFDNARFAAGVPEDPRAMLKRMNELLERVMVP